MALLALTGSTGISLVVVALTCNLFVAGQGAWLFAKRGLLNWKSILPFITTSIPMAFFGGLFKVSDKVWLLVLGCSLILSGAVLMLPKRGEGMSMVSTPPKKLWALGFGLGGGLGFLAGLVGIGGGIFLSPALYFVKVGKAREIAALCCVFIFLNSAAGLCGQFLKGGIPSGYLGHFPLLLAVIFGGSIGSRLASRFFSHNSLRIWTALLVTFAGARVLWQLYS